MLTRFCSGMELNAEIYSIKSTSNMYSSKWIAYTGQSRYRYREQTINGKFGSHVRKMAMGKIYRHGVVIRIFPSGHISDTRSSVVAISQSASSFSFSITENLKKREGI